jgi:ribonuclease P protein component
LGFVRLAVAGNRNSPAQILACLRLVIHSIARVAQRLPAAKKLLTRRRVRGCNSALFRAGTAPSEAHISAVEDASQTHAWFYGADAHPRRSQSRAGAQGEGARKIGRLIAGTGKLPRSARLLRREYYREALAAGPARTRRHFRVYLRANGLGEARLGIIASTQAARRAVDRNRFKRMAREAFRRSRHQLGGMDVVIQLRRYPEDGSIAGARAELARLLEELATRPREG